MREEAMMPLARSGWRWLRRPTATVAAAAAMASSTAAAGVVEAGDVWLLEASVVRQREGVMETGGGVESRPATWSSRAATTGAGGCRLRQRTACGDGRGDHGRGYCGRGGEDGDDEVAGRSAAAAAVAVTAVTGGMAASDG
ncbi:hypothetical protein OsI_07367 [Oryza sativa Indica Group]|uniref:Uncharacterized protein n=1 Tax=Oryza sativa subsp. indica TaxID=39946 RepID=A2X596_ORYSI|nr:hypothetical protein OsI_07367 [Oryza sativa Indica Group]